MPGTPPDQRAARQRPIPFDRHEAILAKAREEATAAQAAAIESARREVFSKYAIPENVDPAQYQRLSDIATELYTNPVAFLQKLATEIQQHPQHAATLRSWAGQALSTGRADGAAADPQPTADLQYSDGSARYSPERMTELLAWQRRQTLRELRAELAPLQEGVNTYQEQQRYEAAKANASSFAQTTYAALAQLPDFEKHKAEIAKHVAAIQIPADATVPQAQAILHLEALNAYNRIVLPTLQDAGRRQAIADLESRARAATRSPHGTGAANPVKDKTPKRFGEALAERMSASQ